MARLIVKFRGALVREHLLDKPSVRIGRREGNDIRIDNLAVSGNHAKIEKINGSFIIVDLKSTNGTFVNNKKIVQAKLRHLDEIMIGKHVLIFEDESQVAGARKKSFRKPRWRRPGSNRFKNLRQISRKNLQC